MLSLPADFTVFVEFCLDGARRYVEFGTRDDRAIVVGSSPQAHLRVDRYGVSPVAFHLERERDGIYVTPGYGTELRLNTALVRSRARLSETSLLEFQGLALQARILLERPDSEPPEMHSTIEHVRAYQLDQPLDSATVRFAVPGLHQPAPELTTSTVELAAVSSPPAPDYSSDTEQFQFFMTEVLKAPVPTPAVPRPTPAPAGASAAPPGADPSLSQRFEHTLALERPALAPEGFSRTQTMYPRGASAPLAPPPASAPATAPPSPPPAHAAPAHAPFVPSPPPAATAASVPGSPSPMLARESPAQPTPLTPVAMSLDAQTTVFETVHAGRSEPRTPIQTPPVSPRVEPFTEDALPPERLGWLTRLGLLTKAKPLPVLASALVAALLVGVGAANAALLFTSAPSGPASVAPKSSAAPKSNTAPAPPTTTSSGSPAASARPLVAKAAPTTAGERRRARDQPNDPVLARAVGDLAAGRYREAAEGYTAVAARGPDPEVYRAIANLLEKASGADCRPSGTAKPFCPEVQQ